jgi:hypothetical protein
VEIRRRLFAEIGTESLTALVLCAGTPKNIMT